MATMRFRPRYSLRAIFIAITLFALWLGWEAALTAQEPTQPQLAPQIYWGDEVPPGWNGDWPSELKTVPERTGYTRTISTHDLDEWIGALKTKGDNVHGNVHVVEMFTSPLKKVAPAMVLANPRVSSPEEARASGKPVVFLMGNIHPPEPEAAEALLMVARDLVAGKRRALLDHLIVMIAPIFNVDERITSWRRTAAWAARRRSFWACAKTRKSSTSTATASSFKLSRPTVCIARSTSGTRCSYSTVT